MSSRAAVQRVAVALAAVLTAVLGAAQPGWGLPNAPVNPGSPPMSDQNNSEVSLSETTPGEVYAVWTEYTPAGFGVSNIGWGFSNTLGAAWVQALIPPTPPYGAEWNPSLASHPAGAFYAAAAAYGPGMPWLAPDAVVVHTSAGGGAAFGPGVPVAVNVPGTTWLDYPDIALADNPAIPAPLFGTMHTAWVEYADGTFGDADGNGNPFDDAGDNYTIFYAYSRTMAGPAPIFPAFSVPVALFPGPVFPNAPAANRPSVAVMAPPGNPVIPGGGVYVGWTDGLNVYVTGSPALGAAFFAPALVAAITPVPPVLIGGVKGAATVTIATGAGPCAGWVYAAWTSVGGADLDIFFSSSPTGLPGSWGPPVRVNQDPIGNGADQWAPHMSVDPGSGRILITYYDRRVDPANVAHQTWVSSSPDCGVTWLDCQLSTTPPAAPISTFPLPPAPIYTAMCATIVIDCTYPKKKSPRNLQITNLMSFAKKCLTKAPFNSTI